MARAPRNIVVFGTGRSGTTWLAEIIAAAGFDLNFEPLDHRLVAEARKCTPRPLFVRDPDHCPWEHVISRMLQGEIRNPSLSTRRQRSAGTVTKLIRANLIASWIVERFDVQAVFIVRNPLSVVASMREQGWYLDPLWPPKLLTDPRFAERFFGNRPEIQELATRDLGDAQARAVFWAVTNFIPGEMGLWDRIPLIRYEELAADPGSVAGALFEELDLKLNRSVLKTLSRPSSMPGFRSRERGYDPTTAWKRILSPGKVRAVIDVVERFGLQEFLGDA